MELKAIPLKFELFDALTLRSLGIGIIVDKRKASGTEPCTVIAVNKQAIRVKQSCPALIKLPDDKSELSSLLRGLSFETTFTLKIQVLSETYIFNTVFHETHRI